MSLRPVVICSKFIKPTLQLEDLIAELFDGFDTTILVSVDNKLDVEGQTFGDSELVEVQINPKSPDSILTLAHELIHVKQILECRPTLEE